MPYFFTEQASPWLPLPGQFLLRQGLFFDGLNQVLGYPPSGGPPGLK